MGESTILHATQHFTNGIIHLFGNEYLMYPNEDDLRRLILTSYERSFPGVLWSIDCMHWQWKKCPTGLAKQCQGKGKKPTLVLKAIIDRDMWF